MRALRHSIRVSTACAGGPVMLREESSPPPQKALRGRYFRVTLALALLVCACACAATPAPDPNRPTASKPVYPTLTETTERRQAALAAWANLTRSQGITNAPAPELQPFTLTLKSIPPLNPPLYLPKVGTGETMTEEETREALRRFTTGQRTLIGADQKELSLVLRTDLADGTKKASYEQHPFRYPLRGGYGRLEIGFTPDRRILQISSTCIPEVEELQKTLASNTPALEAGQVAAGIQSRTFTYTDATGTERTYTVAANEEINVRELVIYPLRSESEPAALELHLAWEITVGKGPSALLVYLDAATNKVIAAAPSLQT
jgi:hypothetical protein